MRAHQSNGWKRIVLATATVFGIWAGDAESQNAGLTWGYANGVLTITGTMNPDRMAIGQLPNGAVTLNGSAILGFSPRSITVFARAGDDYIDLATVVVPSEIHCGQGNDVCYGGASDDTIFAELGNDRVNGRQGSDSIYGGDGDDILNGGQGGDQLFGENGNDTLSGDMYADYLMGGGGSDTFFLGDPWGSVIVYASYNYFRTEYEYDRVYDLGPADRKGDPLNSGWSSFHQWW